MILWLEEKNIKKRNKSDFKTHRKESYNPLAPIISLTDFECGAKSPEKRWSKKIKWFWGFLCWRIERSNGPGETSNGKLHFLCSLSQELKKWTSMLYSLSNQLKNISCFKACVRYFLLNFYFSPSDSPSKTMKNVFYFI